MNSDRVSAPTALRERLAADFAPVRPLASPSIRALSLVPFALLTLVAAQAFFQMRLDAARLGWSGTWGVSIVQVSIGLLLIAAALKEAVPGRGWGRAAATGWLTLPLFLIVAVTYASWGLSPTQMRGSWIFISGLCLVGSAVSALPAVALGSLLAARAYPTRPILAGTLIGLGGGLMADAGWRLFCHFSEPTHVLASHAGGVLVSTAIGAVLATLLSQALRAETKPLGRSDSGTRQIDRERRGQHHPH